MRSLGRLLFVGITRAEERLFLTQTHVREFRGNRFATIPSEFLREMDLVRTEVLDSFGQSPTEPEASATDEPADTEFDSKDNEDFPPSRKTYEPHVVPHDPHIDFASKASAVAKGQRSRPLLTTAADLLNGTNTALGIPQSFSVGMSVRHPRLGLGTVTEAQGIGKWRTVTVQFQDGESQSFVVHKCPLQPVGVR